MAEADPKKESSKKKAKESLSSKRSFSEAELSQVQELLKVIGLALNNITLYTAKHRIAEMSLDRAFQLTDDFLALKKIFEFSLAEEMILVDGTSVEIRNPLIDNLKTQLKNRGVDSLTLHAGLTKEEIQHFLELLTQRYDQKEKVDLTQVIKEKKIVHIVVNQAVFIKASAKDLKKGKGSISAKKRGGDEAGEANQEFVSAFLLGLSQGDAKSKESLLQELEKNPAALANELIELVQNKYESSTQATGETLAQKVLQHVKKIGEVLNNEGYDGEKKSPEQLRGLLENFGKTLEKEAEKDFSLAKNLELFFGYVVGLLKRDKSQRTSWVQGVEKDPKGYADHLVQQFQKENIVNELVSDEVLACVDRIGQLLEKEAYSGKIKSRDHLAQFFKSFEEALLTHLKENPSLKGKSDKALDQMTLRLCKIKVGVLASEYEKRKKSLDSLAKLAKELLTDEKENERIFPLLKSRLFSEGMSEETFREMLEKAGLKSKEKEDRLKEIGHSLEEFISKSFEGLGLKLEEETSRKKSLMNGIQERVERHVLLEQKQLLEEIHFLRSKIDKMEAIFKSIGEAIFVVDAKGKVVFANPAAERLLGQEKEKILEHSLLSQMSDAHMISLSRDHMGEDGTFEPTEIEIRGTRNTIKTLRQSVGLIHNKDGHTVGSVSILSDVTKQKELEQLKSDFVANVSHELRTPLVAIQKSIDLVLNQDAGAINQDQKKFLEISSRNALRLMHMVNDILDVSKIESGKFQLNIQSIHVEPLIKETLLGLKVWGQTKSISLDDKVEEGLPSVLWDRDRISQVLTNFISNAIKFTPENGFVTVEAKRLKDLSSIKGYEVPMDYTTPAEQKSDQGFIVISVSDTGKGMKQEDIDKVFDKFFQIQHASGEKVLGTGLGLPIARQMIEMHHGKLWVRSQLNEGASFVMALPVRDNSLIFS